MITLLLACGGDAQETATAADHEPTWGPVSIDPDSTPPELLSTVGLLRWSDGELTYHDEADPYRLQTPLFSDFAVKDRAVWIPDGQAAVLAEDGSLSYPVGTVILKSFLFAPDMRTPDEGVRLIETRMLLHGTEGWTAWPYLWRTDGTDADLHVAGDVQTIDFIDTYGAERTAQYLVPQRNQCVDCHDQYDDAGERVLMPIGPRSRTLTADMLLAITDQAAPADATAQVDWDAIEADGVDSLSSAEVVTATRDYLDINCAHCHSPRGIEGITSQFFLNHDNTDQFNLGICKRPGSAGEGGENREFDIVPGDPKQSILWYRTATEDVGAMMPDIGRSLTHDVGAALIWRWIAEMEPDDCQE